MKKARPSKTLFDSHLGHGTLPWPDLQRFLMAPLIAGMIIVICVLAAVYAGLTTHPASHHLGVLVFAALGGSFAAALTGAGPRLFSAALIALGATASGGVLLWRLGDLAQAASHPGVASTLRSWTPWLVVPLFVACALATLPAMALRTWLRSLSKPTKRPSQRRE